MKSGIQAMDYCDMNIIIMRHTYASEAMECFSSQMYPSPLGNPMQFAEGNFQSKMTNTAHLENTMQTRRAIIASVFDAKKSTKVFPPS